MTSAVAFLNECQFTATTGGLGDFVVDSAVTGFFTPAQCTNPPVVDGQSYYWRAESASLQQHEFFYGAYTAATATVSRTTILQSSDSGNKVDFNAAPRVRLVAPGQALREIVTSDRTYYVNNSTGSDSRTGRSSAQAFATIQKAVDVICDTLYVAANITIQVETTGSDYDEYVLLRPWVNGTKVTDAAGSIVVVHIIGDTGNQASVRIAPTSAVPEGRGTIVQAIGAGASWKVSYITADGVNVTGTTGVGLWSASDFAKLVVLAGDIGKIYDPNNDQSYSFFSAISLARLEWAFNSGTPSEVYANTATAYGFGWAAEGGICELNGSADFMNRALDFYGFYTGERQGRVYSYHNASFSNTGNVTGRRYFLRDGSLGFHFPSTVIPGSTGGVCGISAFFNQTSFRGGDYTFATLSLSNPSSGSCIRISDANTKTLGAVISAGGGANDVVAIWDGSNWRVAIAFATQQSGVMLVDTIANILVLSPAAPTAAFATDLGQTLVWDGSNWNIDSSYYTPQAAVADLGAEPYSNRIGYGKTSVTDKRIANCWIGQNKPTNPNEGALAFNPASGSFGQFEQYSNGSWHPVVVGLILDEASDASQAIRQTPIGKTQAIVVFNGDSELQGLNGIPLVQGYVASMGPFNNLQVISGGTF